MKAWIDAITQLVQQLGFPITVALYLLIRYDRRLGEQTAVLSKINTALERLIGIANGEEEEEDDSDN